MEGLLQFINNNYIWLIIIAVVILFALIGYIADKNGFNSKKQNSTDKINKVEQSKPESKIEANKKGKKEKQEFIEEIVDEEELEQIDETLMEEIDLNDEDLNLGIESVHEEKTKEEQKKTSKKIKNTSKTKEEIIQTSDLDIDKDFNKVLDDVEEKSSEVNIEIPEDEEDIWKF